MSKTYFNFYKEKEEPMFIFQEGASVPAVGSQIEVKHVYTNGNIRFMEGKVKKVKYYYSNENNPKVVVEIES